MCVSTMNSIRQNSKILILMVKTFPLLVTQSNKMHWIFLFQTMVHWYLVTKVKWTSSSLQNITWSIKTLPHNWKNFMKSKRKYSSNARMQFLAIFLIKIKTKIFNKKFKKNKIRHQSNNVHLKMGKSKCKCFSE